MQELKEGLIQLLTIINYTDDKEKFIKEFLELCLQETEYDVIGSLVPEQQTTLENELTQEEDVDKYPDIFKKYITPQLYQQALSRAVAKSIQTLLDSVGKNLTDEQLTKIENLFPSEENTSESMQSI